MCLSNVFYTVKNWNNLKKGIVVNISTESSSRTNYNFKVSDIRIDSLVYKSGDKIKTNYVIGDTVLVQPKGNKNVRILYVNGKKVGKKISKSEYLSMFFLIIIILIIGLIIKNKIRKK